jgi:hypothetical protein
MHCWRMALLVQSRLVEFGKSEALAALGPRSGRAGRGASSLLPCVASPPVFITAGMATGPQQTAVLSPHPELGSARAIGPGMEKDTWDPEEGGTSAAHCPF